MLSTILLAICVIGFAIPYVIFYMAAAKNDVFPFLPLPLDTFKKMSEKERGEYWRSMAYSESYKINMDLKQYAKHNIKNQLDAWGVTFNDIKHYLPKEYQDMI